MTTLDREPEGFGRADPSSAGLATEAVVRALADASRGGILVTDASGRVAYANTASADLLRRPQGDLLGVPAWALFPAEAQGKVRAMFGKGLASPGRPWTTEVDMGGAMRASVSLTVTSHEPPPAVRAVVVRLREANDETRAAQREQELEAQLRQAQKMMAVGRMTAGIAHDFDNVLAVITATADLMHASIDPSEKVLLEDLRTLREAADTGADIVAKLMGFSRTAPVELAETNVGSLLQRMRPLLDRLIPDGIDFEMILAPKELAFCDATAVEQMVTHLVTNARDAMPTGGRLRLTVAGCEIEEEADSRPQWLDPGTFVRLSIQDSGPGMDEATLGRVLEPFFTTKELRAGAGLGLSMVYGLAKQQGGFVHIVSDPGQGTTAHIYLPKPPMPGPTAQPGRADALKSRAGERRSA